MPTRRVMELAVVVAIGIHPVTAMVRLWCDKHLATSSRQSTQTLARVARRVF